MAKAKEVKDSKQESNTGIIVMGGEIEASDFDSLDWHTQLQDYTNMRNGDGIINTSLRALKLPIESSNYRIEAGSENDIAKEAADYGDWEFKNLIGGYESFKRHCLLSLDYGLSLFEKIYKRGVKYFNGTSNKTTNIISRFSPIENDTITEFHYDKDTMWAGITHEKRVPESGSTDIPIDAKKLFRMSFNEEYNDVRGRSILRPVREAWNYRKKILNATTRASQRGAGIPIATVYGDITDSTKSKAQKMLRTVGNAENAYAIEQKEKIEIRLEELKTQQNNLPLLEILNREIFFNSLTQFMTSGLGQSGSRAAASELKSTYELAASSIQQWLEEGMQRILDEMIDISYLAGIAKEDRPIFKFDNISQVDANKASVNVKNLLDSGAITKDAELEKFLRSLFDYPEKKEINADVATEESEEDTPTEIQEDDLQMLEVKDRKKKNLARVQEIFEFESANKQFLKSQEEVESITNDMLDKIFRDIGGQLKDNRKKNIDIRFSREFVSKLTKIYEDNLNNGALDFLKELNKIKKLNSNTTELERVNLIKGKKSIRRGIERAVRNMANSIKSAVESTMDKLTDEALLQAGGTGQVLAKIKTDGFKTRKREVIVETEKGYTDGRGEIVRLAGNEVSLIYSASLDGSLCDTCAPLDATEHSFNEVQASGLNFNQPINPNCQGSDKCRCQWVSDEITDEGVDKVNDFLNKEGIDINAKARQTIFE